MVNLLQDVQDDYLTKPFTDTELLEAIQSRLKKHDFLRRRFSKSVEGISQFIEAASEYMDMDHLSRDYTPVKYTKKDFLFMEGDTANSLYFIESGIVTIAQGIKNAHPDDVFLINIHTGGYAVPGNNEPDFRTPFGSALAAQTGLVGYPAATVNRQNFPGREQGASGTTALNRNNWVYASNQILADNSYVNLAVTASIESSTNVMSIHVEGYYTGDSPEPSNLLNVVILQNNTKGPQTGGGAGNNYNHMHRLIDMVTGQWGEEITTTTSETFFERDYTYSIIPHVNLVPVEINDLEVVVFLTETHQKIVSGNGTIPVVSTTYNNDANVRYIETFAATCEGENQSVSPHVNIQNAGVDPITSLDINYSLNGVPATYSWTGMIESLKSETIALPSVDFTVLSTNTIEVSIPNDDYNNSNSKTLSFDPAPSGTGTVNMVLRTDGYGNECRWNLKDSSGTILYSGGPYGNRQTITERFTLEEDDCYSFTVIDTYGDGGTAVTLTDHEGTQLFYTDGSFGSNFSRDFHSNGVLGVNQNEIGNINVYPNPTRDILNITNAENASIQLFDILGKHILSKENISFNEELNVSGLQAGAYFLKISKEGSSTTKKIIVTK